MVAVRANSSEYYIGIMSGTSLDGIDLSLLNVSTGEEPSEQPTIKSISNRFAELPKRLKDDLSTLSNSPQIDAIKLGQVPVQLAKLFAEHVNKLLADNDISAEHITAIGCHGVTIRHYPELEHGFSLQITDGNTLAQLTGIDVITDFRGMDVAAGGQGAPLVPAFHQVLFSSEYKGDTKTGVNANTDRIVLNLGGIANLSVLRAEHDVIGFDTGPANTLLDLWCLKHTGQNFDRNGLWASGGICNDELLTDMLEDAYFVKAYPKSTGKEQFNLDWLQQRLERLNIEVVTPDDAQSIQRTLAHLTAKSIADQVKTFDLTELLVCGGGAQNQFIMELLVQYLPNMTVRKSDAYSGKDNTEDTQSFDPNAIEAMAFAWLAYCRVHNISANSPSVTGSNKNVVMGAWYSSKSTCIAAKENKTNGKGAAV